MIACSGRIIGAIPSPGTAALLEVMQAMYATTPTSTTSASVDHLDVPTSQNQQVMNALDAAVKELVGIHAL